MSGDAPSDVNDWLGYALSDANRSAAMVALREQVRVSIGSNVTPDAKRMFEFYYTQLSAGPPFPSSISSSDSVAWFDGGQQAYSDTAGTILQNTIGGVVGRVNEAAPLAGSWVAPSNGQRPTHDSSGLRFDFAGSVSAGTTMQRLAAASVPLNNATIAFSYVDRDGIGGQQQGLIGIFSPVLGVATGGGQLSPYINAAPTSSGIVVPRAQHCTVVIRWTPTACKIYFLSSGIVQQVTLPATITGGTTGGSGIALGFAAGGTQGANASLSQAIFLNRAITDAETVQLAAYVDAKPVPVGYPTTAPFIAINGDSIAAGAAGTLLNDAWAWVMEQNLRQGSYPTAEVGNFAISGSGTAPATIAACLPFWSGARAKNIAFLASGTNDIATGNFATLIAAYWAQCDSLRATGYKVIACTVLPRTDAMAVSQATFDANRASFNTEVTTNWTLHADALANAAAVAGMSTNADVNAGINYSVDKVHPNGIGHRLLEPTYRAAAISLL